MEVDEWGRCQLGSRSIGRVTIGEDISGQVIATGTRQAGLLPTCYTLKWPTPQLTPDPIPNQLSPLPGADHCSFAGRIFTALCAAPFCLASTTSLFKAAFMAFFSAMAGEGNGLINSLSERLRPSTP